MFSLSIFAFILPCLMLLAFFIEYSKEKRIGALLAVWLIMTIGVFVLVGSITVDCLSGEKIIEMSIKIDGRNSSNKGFFMYFSDSEDRKYWGFGSISRIHYSGSVEVPVRITYSPNMKYVLKIERYTGNIPEIFDIPDIPIITPNGIEYASDKDYEYTEIYSNDSAWGLGCLVILGMIIFVIAGDTAKKK